MSKCVSLLKAFPLTYSQLTKAAMPMTWGLSLAGVSLAFLVESARSNDPRKACAASLGPVASAAQRPSGKATTATRMAGPGSLTKDFMGVRPMRLAWMVGCSNNTSSSLLADIARWGWLGLRVQ